MLRGFAILAASLGALAAHAQETRTSEIALPDGGKVVREEVVDAAGDATANGKYDEFFADGKKRATGRYEKGERTGNWSFFLPDGKVAAKGRYERGFRVGDWRVTPSGGKPDPARSGTYKLASAVLPFGAKCEGPTLAGQRIDRWRFRRSDGSTFLEGDYLAGKPSGEWLLVLEDGSVDPEWITGVYDGRKRVGAADPVSLALRRTTPRHVSSLPALTSFGERDADPAQRGVIDVEVAGFVQRADARDQFGPTLLAHGFVAVPSLLDGLAALDPADAANREPARLLVERVLRPIFHGHGFRLDGGATDEVIAADRRAILRWRAFHDLLRFDPAFLAYDLPLADKESVGVTPPDPILLYTPRVMIAHLPGATVLATRGRVKRDPAVDALIEHGLDWLARHQEITGEWSCEKFVHHCVGDACGGATDDTFSLYATALTLRAFLTSGDITRHRDVIGKATSWLMTVQEPSGGFGTHDRSVASFATLEATRALSELAALSGSAAVLDAADRAAEYLLSLRQADGAWGFYVDRSDAWSTSQALVALTIAKSAGARVDPGALDRGIEAIAAWTLRETGRTGFTEPGSLSPRDPATAPLCDPVHVELVTAAAITARFLLSPSATDPRKDSVLQAGVKLLAAKPPRFTPVGGSTDYLYWAAGAEAMSLAGGAEFDSFYSSLLRAATDSQVKDGCAAGSWSAVNVPYLGYIGTRIAATATLVIALDAPGALAHP